MSKIVVSRKWLFAAFILFSFNLHAQSCSGLFAKELANSDVYPQFEKINEQEFLPAIQQAIRVAERRIKIIRGEKNPTFETVILAFEESGRELERVGGLFALYSLSYGNKYIEKIENDAEQIQEQFSLRTYSDSKLFEQVKKVYDAREKLASDQKLLVEKYYNAFILSGVGLDSTQSKRYQEISNELTELGVLFGQNVKNYKAAFSLVVENAADLAGLSPSTVSRLKQKATEKNVNGYLITLEPSLYLEIMEKAESSELRKKLYLAMSRVAYGSETDNTPLVQRIADLRNEQAQILGFKDYASFALSQRMAKDVETVDRFVSDAIDAYFPYAQKEEKELRQYVITKRGFDDLQPWDRTYWSKKLLEEKYAFNVDVLKEYFELNRVQNGLFELAERLYGIKMVERKDLSVPHSDAIAYEVRDSKGGTIAYLLVDLYARLGSKKDGAWHLGLTSTYQNNGQRVVPVSSIHLNLSKVAAGEPSLLTIYDVETLFHEFGHALHSMLSTARYSSQAGTNVKRDFVELPSQFMENFVFQKEVLNTFAFHYQTGELLPAEYLNALQKAKNFRVATAALRQFQFVLLDMAWHKGERPAPGKSLSDWEKAVTARVRVFENSEDVVSSTSFSHIFNGGYSAGYYSYKWAEVLDADAFSIFMQEGIFNPVTAARFRKFILEVGGSVDPMEAFIQFAGRPPRPEAMLERDGLKKP